MDKISLKVRAKINLSLEIMGIMENKFHELDTIMCPIDIADVITVTIRNDKEISCNCCPVPKEKNIAYKTAKYLQEKYNTCGVDIKIDKNIPFEGGLGGSSADSAGVLYSFYKLFNISFEDVVKDSSKFGSDITFMLLCDSYGMRAKGKGDILEPIELNEFDLVIVKPDKGVPTPTSFKLYDEKYLENKENSNIENIVQNKNFAKYLSNDLYKPACELNVDVKIIYERLKIYTDYVNMSGSGSSVFALNIDYNKVKEDKILNQYNIYKTKTVKTSIEII